MTDSDLTRIVDDILTRECTAEVRRAAEESGWSARLWEVVAEAGLVGLSVPEHLGGSGGSTADVLEVLRLAGRHALPLPLAETAYLGGWLHAQAGFPFESKPVAVASDPVGATLDASGQVSGAFRAVAWARAADRLVTLVAEGDHYRVAQVALAHCTVTPDANLAGEPRDHVRIDRVRPERLSDPVPGVTPRELHLRGALSRACLVSGALDTVLETTVRYTNQRVQFGRPVARFQAVQVHTTRLAEDAALAAMATEAAVTAAAAGPCAFEVAAAKVTANDCARSSARAAHQAHGAMGMTREYPLNDFTRRLWSWRREYGSSASWREVLGRLVLDAGAETLYPLITAGSQAVADLSMEW